ncbi:hypothetical protein PHLCEN_2v12874 [Hermanssonia centrifuga]|uniref:Xylanolytic transcriptional activator regulatory domain-containing protein n=1 Tax=Hermanssonia centrifuga TaxID=98765 RepID=A0A2R6NFR8_9APHY|nr:hypothetical protein PHLCEN_2v12874 [Hermanssonia centrifuga]
MPDYMPAMFAQQQTQDASSGTQKVQKRRRMRACDMCRQRKEKILEYKLQLRPDIEDPQATSRSLETHESVMTEGTTRSPGATRVPRIVAGYEDDDVESSDDEIAAHRSLVESFQKISLRPEYDHDHSHFFGKSSSFVLVQTAMEMKHEYALGNVFESPRRDDFCHRRPEFWAPYPWMLEAANHRDAQYSFPEAGLMTELVRIYFTTMNIYIPLLHEPTFLQNIEKGLHLTNQAFGATLLLVCALGSRQSDDPRVLLEGTDTWHSAGWSWFRQVLTKRNAFILAPPQIYDLQIACLAAMYMSSSSAPSSAWTLVGTGLRMAQDMGAHRRKMYNGPPTVEGELRKRAFWVLIAMDRMMCSMLGRPCSIQDEDFDVDLPIECDDEYWVHLDPSKAFTQPRGKPSLITCFNCTLRLDRLSAFALRTIVRIFRILGGDISL